ncbi:MAG: hypothetical protein HWE13_01940 [Gammaproteobacteria bacterium]|nr:hypothetical protein [Gammaproteobacteria bacterium]
MRAAISNFNKQWLLGGVLMALLLPLSGCRLESSDEPQQELFLFFVQYTNSAFGQDFKTYYINGDGAAVKAMDSELPNLTLDGSYTQQELEDYYFPNQSLIGVVSLIDLDALVTRSLTLDDSTLEKVSDTVCADAGTYRYGFYHWNRSTQEYEETLLFTNASDGVYLNIGDNAEFITEYLMGIAVIADIAYEQLGACGGYWDFSG